MRAGHDSWLWVVVLLLSSVALGRADDAKPTPTPNAPTSFFQSLSLGSNKGPVNIDSDSLELDYKANLITYIGHVHVVQGDVTLTSDRMTISYDPQALKQDNATPAPGSTPGPTKTPGPKGAKNAATGAPGTDSDNIKEIIAEGNVRIVQGTKTAEGKRAVYDKAKQTFTLSDGAVLHDGPNTVAGERVIVYLKEDRSVVESGSNGRVKAVLYPKEGTSPSPTPPAMQAANSSPEAHRQ
jgi:lipopolysaccharide export system protein LptA